ncbi:hypothetical protein [Streptomyces wuyuanensis]|uniref:hypothetical protein n=1 Tax=Streptomyces wuyuanensis TaxID=1196353 RepID=UPI0037BE0589
MFGSLAFLHEGNMAVGVIGDEPMLRAGSDAALARRRSRSSMSAEAADAGVAGAVAYEPGSGRDPVLFRVSFLGAALCVSFTRPAFAASSW